MAPTLVSLPTELILMIAKHLNVPHSGSDGNPVPSLILVCPRLRDVFSPALYRSINTTSRRRVALLLRTILENPSVGERIHSVDFVRMDIPGDQDWSIFPVRRAVKSIELTLLAQAAWSTFLTEGLAKQCLQDAHLGDRDAILALLIAHLPNLETLAFGLREGHAYDYPMILFGRVAEGNGLFSPMS